LSQRLELIGEDAVEEGGHVPAEGVVGQVGEVQDIGLLEGDGTGRRSGSAPRPGEHGLTEVDPVDLGIRSVEGKVASGAHRPRGTAGPDQGHSHPKAPAVSRA